MMPISGKRPQKASIELSTQRSNEGHSDSNETKIHMQQRLKSALLSKTTTKTRKNGRGKLEKPKLKLPETKTIKLFWFSMKKSKINENVIDE